MANDHLALSPLMIKLAGARVRWRNRPGSPWGLCRQSWLGWSLRTVRVARGTRTPPAFRLSPRGPVLTGVVRVEASDSPFVRSTREEVRDSRCRDIRLGMSQRALGPARRPGTEAAGPPPKSWRNFGARSEEWVRGPVAPEWSNRASGTLYRQHQVQHQVAC